MKFGDEKVIVLLQAIEKYILFLKKDKELRSACKDLGLSSGYKTYKEKYKEAKDTAKDKKVGSDISYRNSIAKKIQQKFLEEVAREKYKNEIYKLTN